MLNPNTLEIISKQIADKLPPTFKNLGDEFEESLKMMLQGICSELNLVPRELFDMQAASLDKARLKLEALEQRLSVLEAAKQETPEDAAVPSEAPTP